MTYQFQSGETWGDDRPQPKPVQKVGTTGERLQARAKRVALEGKEAWNARTPESRDRLVNLTVEEARQMRRNQRKGLTDAD